jgi:putative ABC transport system ATP-binding protein
MKLSSLIELANITKVYQSGNIKTSVLHDISLRIEETELVAIVGSSGSGKSSLMNIIGLLDKQTTGDYRLNGTNITKLSPPEIANIRNQQIGFIFQAFFLLPRLTILQNVSLPLTYREMADSLIDEQARQALQRVGLAHLAHRYPKELSGGQQQRVAIARALVGKPNVILADEPTGALDSKIGQEIMDLFIQLNSLDKNTIIIITHDPKIANQCSRIIHIQDGLILPQGDS